MDILYIVGLLGTGVFAITGALTAIEHRMDVFGVLVIAFLVGNGGGTIRSAILGTTPVFWLSDPSYIWATIIPALILFLLLFFIRNHAQRKNFSSTVLRILRQVLLIADALGLGLFSIVGTEIALRQNISILGAIILGMITAVGGGVIRDILCNRVPLILQQEVYATAALLGSTAYIYAKPYINNTLDLSLAISFVVVLRLLSVYRNWHIPLI